MNCRQWHVVAPHYQYRARFRQKTAIKAFWKTKKCARYGKLVSWLVAAERGKLALSWIHAHTHPLKQPVLLSLHLLTPLDQVQSGMLAGRYHQHP
jgi:hypothetical protein